MTAKCATVGEIIKALKRNPMDMPVAYASDEEGNSFHPILCTPGPLPLEDIEPLIPEYEKKCFGEHKTVVVIN